MKPTHVGQVIAERHCTLQKDSNLSLVFLRIGLPIYESENKEQGLSHVWWTPFEISGFSSQDDSLPPESEAVFMVAGGEDSLQSLTIAIGLARTVLLHEAEKRDANIYWLDPKWDPILDPVQEEN